MNLLSDRQQREADFHNSSANDTVLSPEIGANLFLSITAPENRWIMAWIGDIKGKRILDIGSGAGEASIFFATHGASVTALDISAGQLSRLSETANRLGLNIETHCGPAESLPYCNGYFDVIYGNGVLHHIDLKESVPELLRVLKENGKAAFIEPLAYNPAIEIYRWIARSVRTPDERPLTRGQINYVRSQFTDGDHREFWLMSLIVFIWMFIIQRLHPGRIRYWKHIIEHHDYYSKRFGWAFAADRLVANLPIIRWLCWNTVIYGHGRPANIK